jgi:hypothetical protein
MIIFYNNKTGEVVGNIEGRIHPESHLTMWISPKDTTSRIICNWKQIEGSQDYEPEIQKEIFTKLDQDPSKIYDYKVDLKTKTLVIK